MTTDEMILDLHEKAGFVLPEGLGFNLVGKFWRVKGEPHAISGFETIPDRQAYDQIACECARELTHGKRNNARALGLLGDPLDLFREWLGKGDTEAAIRALWEAVCGGKP